jgi:tRNA nucleotidyltransferase/poly(A) polymerase
MELFAEIGKLAAEGSREAYFVGGCVRDLLRGEPIKDLDLAIMGDPLSAGRRIAKRLDGHVFWLREDEQVARVALPKHDRLQVDLVRLRGSLKEDLYARDLTINAMAVAAAQGLYLGAEILDPAGGRMDLKQGVVRFVSPASPRSDPLRVMRALRFRWKLGFRLAEEVPGLIRECAPLLKQVSVERVRDELFQLLSIPQAAEALEECLEFDLGPWLFGQSLDGEIQTAVPVRVAEVLALLDKVPEELAGLLGTEPTPPRRRREVLLWGGALQAASGRIPLSRACRYLALSNDEVQLIEKGIAQAPRVRELATRWPVPGRELYHLFKKAGKAGPEAVILAVPGTEWSSPYPELLKEALRRHLHPEAPLLTGQEVMHSLGVPPGPTVGRALEALEEARADGLIRDRDTALAWLASWRER